MLRDREKRIINSGSIFSHGDLCLSNILASEKFDRLVLIDPRGGSFNESVRSIYYDFAKLSHSINGNYDKIINGFADIKFKEDLKIELYFKGDENISFSKKLTSLSETYGLDIELIRIIEVSLFFSMLPLHIENKTKVAMLAINGCRILNNIN
jgi:thiamine kinase-like enzyme